MIDARAVAATVAAAAVVTGAGLVGEAVVSDPVAPLVQTASPTSYGVKVTLKGCGQRVTGTTRVGGKGVLWVSGDNEWWIVKSVTVKSGVPGEDFVPPFPKGLMLPGTWVGSGFADTKGGTFQFWFGSKGCPGASTGYYRSDSSIVTITVLPKLA
jgi:hypothetical protein